MYGVSGGGGGGPPVNNWVQETMAERESQPAEVREIMKRTMEGEKDRKKSSRKVKEGVCYGGGGGGRLVSATSSHHHREIPPTSLLNATSVLDVSGAADTKASISEREPLCETSVSCVRTSSAYTLGGEATTDDHCAAERANAHNAQYQTPPLQTVD